MAWQVLRSIRARCSYRIEILSYRVLIVEDNVTARTVLERLLTLEGFAVVSAGTLKDAIEKMEGQDAVILDLDLPDGSGFEVLKRIRASGGDVKALVTTGSTDLSLLNKVEHALPDALFRKPVDVRQIVDLLGPTGAGN